MHAGRILYTCRIVTRCHIDTVCRRLLDAAAGRAEVPMLAQDLPTFRRTLGLYQSTAVWHFGRAAYCTWTPLTNRSPRDQINPRQIAHSTRLSTAAHIRQSERSYACTAAHVLEANTASSSSEPDLPKFGRRTSVKDVKVRKPLT